MGAHMKDASRKLLKVSNSISLIEANKTSWIDSNCTNGWLNLASKNKLAKFKIVKGKVQVKAMHPQ